MRQKSNMNVAIAAIDSRTRMKRSAIRIHFTYDGIHGPALLCPPTTEPSMIQRRGLEKPTPVAIVGRNLHGLELALQDMGARRRNRIGTSACDIYRITTSSGSVIAPRSSSGQITFASTSNTVMPVRAGNGPTCWKTHVCWKKSRLYRRREGEPRSMPMRSLVGWLAQAQCKWGWLWHTSAVDLHEDWIEDSSSP